MASDVDAGAAGPPGQFTVIIHLFKIKVVLCFISYIYIQMSNYNNCCRLCSVQFPLLLQFLFLAPVKMFLLLLDVSIILLSMFGGDFLSSLHFYIL